MLNDESPPTHDFDAGALGCGTGLAGEVRRHIADVRVGERLRVIARDPSAREEVPALVRLLGHHVITVEVDGDTAIIIVERSK
jgi:TusA-related sulfurtransferase